MQHAAGAPGTTRDSPRQAATLLRHSKRHRREQYHHPTHTALKSNALKEHKTRWAWMTFDIHRATYALAPEYHRDNVYNNNPVMNALKRIIRFYAESAATETTRS